MDYAARTSNGSRSRLIAAIRLATSCTALIAGGAYAADAAKDAPVQQDIVVTGSRIPRINEKSASPVAVIGAAEAKFQGTTHVEDLLNTLPQVNAGLNGGASGPTGTATVDLRGFGAFRTLVLMDGRRINPGDPINPGADLNSIPVSLVKRVEVLTGGAASVYGSDAIAGVVNFIMDDNFNGFKVDAQYSLNQYSNKNSSIQAVNAASGIPSNTGSGFDGGIADINATYGTKFAGGAGHVEVYAGYRHTNQILSNKRDFGACNLNENGNSFSCLLDATNSAAGVFNGNTTIGAPNGSTTRPFNANVDGYNNSQLVSPYAPLQRPDERYDAGFFANYEFSPHAKFYFEGQYSHDHTVQQYSPAYTNGANFTINCNNPLLSADEFTAFCTNATPDPNLPAGFVNLTLGKVNVEGSPRLDEFTHDSYRTVLGLKGKLSHIWSYDVYGSYGIAKSKERISNDLSLSRIQNGLNVVNVGGTPTCTSVVDGTDPACVPYDVFTLGNVSSAAEKYVTAGAAQSGYASRAVLSGVIVGKLGEYGIKSPFANEGIGIVGGTEYRVESVKNTPDAAFKNGDLATTSPQRDVGGTFRVYEFFTEAHVPIADDKPLIKSLSFDFSDRYAHYSLQGTTNSYKIGSEYAPVSDIRFRATFSRTTRAPNGHELFASDTILSPNFADPCVGLAVPPPPAPPPAVPPPTATLAQCLNTGLTAAQYGTLGKDTGHINAITGGNVNLKPETANTFTAGAVFSPSFIPRFSLTVDYWHIKVTNFIGPISAASSVSNCILSGAPVFCSAIHRDANGYLSQGNSLTTGNVFAFNRNTGFFTENGIDFSSNYSTKLGGDAGKLLFNFSGSWTLGSAIGVPGQDTFDCIGLYGPNCTNYASTTPIPKWRHELRTTYDSPKGFEVSLNWRYTGPLNSEFSSNSPTLNNGGGSTPSAVDGHIKAYNYFDLAANVDIAKRYNLRVGVNNIFGVHAPLTGNANNDTILPGNQIASYYDTLGRYMFVGLSLKL